MGRSSRVGIQIGILASWFNAPIQLNILKSAFCYFLRKYDFHHMLHFSLESKCEKGYFKFLGIPQKN